EEFYTLKGENIMLSVEGIKDVIGGIEIVKKFDKSGQKQVFLVRHISYGDIILKVVEGKDERVRREISIVTNNNLENVPKILEIHEYNYNGEEGFYIFEEFIDGSTLSEILKKGKLSIYNAIGLAESLLQTVYQLEKIGVVHRDIKPDNIIREKGGKWYLIDFGIARVLNMESLTLTEAHIGPHTPGYGAPELFQYSKKEIDNRADLFSIGVVLFEAVTGEHPFIRGDEININEVWYKTKTIMPKNIIIEGDIDMQFMSLIQTFMQKHVTRRPRNAEKALNWFKIVKNIIMGE
ncbi:MAG: serine/threonine protein kinase, partial [Vulcanibacillus sp.]